MSAAYELPGVGASGVLLDAATVCGVVIWGKGGGARRIPVARRLNGNRSDDQQGIVSDTPGCVISGRPEGAALRVEGDSASRRPI